MISYIKGKVISKNPVSLILECSNVAFEVNIPVSTYEKLPDIGRETCMFIHFSVADDGIKLFGFISIEEKDLFKMLISVNGIGPKIALTILSSIDWRSFIKHIRHEDHKALVIVPGLGKKTAQRLILELKDKIEKSDLIYATHSEERTHQNIYNEAESALVTLGYKLADIRRVFDTIENQDQVSSSEELIKVVIKRLYQIKKGG